MINFRNLAPTAALALAVRHLIGVIYQQRKNAMTEPERQAIRWVEEALGRVESERVSEASKQQGGMFR